MDTPVDMGSSEESLPMQVEKVAVDRAPPVITMQTPNDIVWSSWAEITENLQNLTFGHGQTASL
jgi:hypothetical protein